MNNFMYKLARFMYGRNGMDALGYAAMALYFAVFAVNYFVNSIYVTIFGFLIVFLALFRFFSKNLARRRRENEIFMRFFNPTKAFIRQTVRRLRDIKTHRYRTCPNCKVTLRLPFKRGTHTVVCPRCKTRVKVRVWI